MPKKLIEVALPLDAINKAAGSEKSVRQGHPSTMHVWWAPRPLAAARAVTFAQMVDDPSSCPDLFKTPKAQEKERQRLFRIIEDLVQWDNTTNEKVLQAARDEIWNSWRRTCAENADHPQAKDLFDRTKLPAFHDPFVGGGALPLEAQRLGLESHSGDLNPVAVLITKAKVEIPPKFSGRPPVNPEARKNEELITRGWHGAAGLADDIAYYGKWMRDQAEKRIGHLYPKVQITTEMAKERKDLKPLVGQRLNVIAWIWARTVKSPNPAFSDIHVPLASTFILSTKAGKKAYVEPLLDSRGYRFTLKVGEPKEAERTKLGTTVGKRSAFRCLMSDVPISYDYIRAEGKAGRMGARLMAIVAGGERGRVYLSPTPEHEKAGLEAKPEWKPDMALPDNTRDFKTPNYGLTNFGDLFTLRQLVALTTLSELVRETREQIMRDSKALQTTGDGEGLSAGGVGTAAYADAIALYLALAVDKAADYNSTIAGWISSGETIRGTFGRQAILMTWDFAEASILGTSTGSFDSAIRQIAKAVEMLPAFAKGWVLQGDARVASPAAQVVSTDPPYYDNIGYADLSDFFYMWLRPSLKSVFPDLFATLAVPKAEELVATPYRHGGKEQAETFFLEGMTQAMHSLTEQAHPAFPITIYYAFKQSESDDEEGTASTGWDTFLEAAISAGFSITGTWPIRTERSARAIGIGSNALASSIVLVCRPRAADAPVASRRDFATALKVELPDALAYLQRGNIAPVDLAQAAIGPGMALFTRYSKVLDAKGEPVRVREALALINQTLDEALAAQEGDFDADTRWALAWFEQSGFAQGEYGMADVLARAKNTSVEGMKDAGILASKSGKVRLFRPAEMAEDWDPTSDERLTAWETVQQLVRALEAGGEAASAVLYSKLGSRAEPARELAYRLYALCERKKRAPEALSYNALVQSWPEIVRLAREEARPQPTQGTLSDEE
jgi:putative DNA methylase